MLAFSDSYNCNKILMDAGFVLKITDLFEIPFG